MLEVKGTLQELKQFYAQLGLVDTTTPLIKKRGNLRFFDPVASMGMGFHVQYEMNPKTGMLRRRRVWKHPNWTTSYTTYLNSETREKMSGTFGGWVRKTSIPIHSLEGLMSRGVSPILHYRQLAEKQSVIRQNRGF